MAAALSSLCVYIPLAGPANQRAVNFRPISTAYIAVCAIFASSSVHVHGIENVLRVLCMPRTEYAPATRVHAD